MPQFFYRSARSTEEKIIIDSFNVNNVLRTTETEEGHLLVQLNDGRIEETVFWKRHPETKEVLKNKEGNPIKMHTAKEWTTSDMLIADPEDIKRFRETVNVNYGEDLSMGKELSEEKLLKTEL